MKSSKPKCLLTDARLTLEQEQREEATELTILRWRIAVLAPAWCHRDAGRVACGSGSSVATDALRRPPLESPPASPSSLPSPSLPLSTSPPRLQPSAEDVKRQGLLGIKANRLACTRAPHVRKRASKLLPSARCPPHQQVNTGQTGFEPDWYTNASLRCQKYKS